MTRPVVILRRAPTYDPAAIEKILREGLLVYLPLFFLAEKTD